MDDATLAALLAAATPGPWRDPITADDYSLDRTSYDDDDHLEVGLSYSFVGPSDDNPVACVMVPSSFGMDDRQEANSALIALAPALATEVLELRARLRSVPTPTPETAGEREREGGERT